MDFESIRAFRTTATARLLFPVVVTAMLLVAANLYTGSEEESNADNPDGLPAGVDDLRGMVDPIFTEGTRAVEKLVPVVTTPLKKGVEYAADRASDTLSDLSKLQ